MALTAQQQNEIVRYISLADELLGMADRTDRETDEWDYNDVFNQLVDADVTALFPHLTKSEVSNCVTSFKNIVIAIAAERETLIKMRG